MDENTIRIIPLTGEKERFRMWSGKSMERAVIKGYHVLLTGAEKIPSDDKDERQEK